MNSAKIFVLGAAAAAFLATTGCEKGGVKTDEERASYAVGLQIGKSLKAQNAQIAMGSLVAGLNDGYGGKEPKLKPEELQQAMQKMQEAMIKKSAEAAEENLKSGEKFLEANKAKAGWKVTESGLQINTVKEGTGRQPTEKDIVKVHYTGTLINNEKFDSSVDRKEPAEFPVGGVIPGWTEALKLMKAGGQYKLAIPAKLAYRDQGRPGIPANSTLLFDVELLEVKDAPAPPSMPHGAPGPKGKKK